MTTPNLVDEAIRRAGTDTIGTQPDAYLRQCCDRVWIMIRERLEAGGHTLAAALVQQWCQPEWVKAAVDKVKDDLSGGKRADEKAK